MFSLRSSSPAIIAAKTRSSFEFPIFMQDEALTTTNSSGNDQEDVAINIGCNHVNEASSFADRDNHNHNDGYSTNRCNNKVIARNDGFEKRFDAFEDSYQSGMSDDNDDIYSTTKSKKDVAVHLFQNSIPSHLLMVALLEHICSLYDCKQNKSEQLFKVLCQQLTAMKLIPSFAVLEEFQSIRVKYRSALTDLMKFAMETAQQQDDVHRIGIQRPLPWYFNTSLPKLAGKAKKPEMRTPSRYYEEFEEIDELGTGGFGSVFEVRNKLDGRRYAVKKIKFAQVDPNNCLMVLREVKVLANLDNANIVRYHSAWLEYSVSEKKPRLTRNPSQSKSLFGKESNQHSILRPRRFGIQNSFSSYVSVEEKDNEKDESSSILIFEPHSENDINNDVLFDNDQRVHKDLEQNMVKRNGLYVKGYFGEYDVVKTLETKEASQQYDEKANRRAISCDNHHYQRNKKFVAATINAKSVELEVTLFIQMQLCLTTLKHWLNERNNEITGRGDDVNWTENMTIFKQLLQGVSYIHKNGLMHRDLKPQNVFINKSMETKDVEIKIGDFGLAKPVNDILIRTELQRHNSLKNFLGSNREDYFATKGIGTCTYAAPEQLQTNSYTSKADIYSLGIILFELFTPFKTEMERHMMIKDLRHGIIPGIIWHHWYDETDLIRQMTDLIPDKRPNAADILQIKNFQDKDKIITMLQTDLGQKINQIKQLKDALQEKNKENEILRRRLNDVLQIL